MHLNMRDTDMFKCKEKGRGEGRRREGKEWGGGEERKRK